MGEKKLLLKIKNPSVQHTEMNKKQKLAHLLAKRDTLNKHIRKLEEEMNDDRMSYVISYLIGDKDYSNFSYGPLIEEIGEEELLSTILSSWKSWNPDKNVLSQLLFLVCALGDNVVVLPFLREVYDFKPEWYPKLLQRSLIFLEMEFSRAKKGDEHLFGYMEVIRKNVTLFGYERTLSFFDFSEAETGYVVAEFYQQGFPLERIDFNKCVLGDPHPISLLLDIFDKASVPLTSPQVEELAIYALRNFDIRKEYEEVGDKAFHEALILNANIVDLHPDNADIRPYLESIAPLEEQV